MVFPKGILGILVYPMAKGRSASTRSQEIVVVHLKAICALIRVVYVVLSLTGGVSVISTNVDGLRHM